MDVIRGYKYTFKERELVCVNWEIKNERERVEFLRSRTTCIRSACKEHNARKASGYCK